MERLNGRGHSGIGQALGDSEFGVAGNPVSTFGRSSLGHADDVGALDDPIVVANRTY